MLRDEDYKLPCDVKLPPATTIAAGCSLATLKLAMESAGRSKRFADRSRPPGSSVPDPQAPSCSNCAHCSNGTCVRPIGTHFSAGFNGYRSRLHVGCALERNRTRDLTKRECCGPSGRFFEPKGADLPIRGMSGTAIIDEAASFVRDHDTVADSDGDDGA